MPVATNYPSVESYAGDGIHLTQKSSISEVIIVSDINIVDEVFSLLRSGRDVVVHEDEIKAASFPNRLPRK